MSNPRIKAVMNQVQNEVIKEFISFYNSLEQSIIAACKGRWNDLSDTLKMKEPHSLPNLHASLYCSRLYVNYVKDFGLY